MLELVSQLYDELDGHADGAPTLHKRLASVFERVPGVGKKTAYAIYATLFGLESVDVPPSEPKPKRAKADANGEAALKKKKAPKPAPDHVARAGEREQ